MDLPVGPKTDIRMAVVMGAAPRTTVLNPAESCFKLLEAACGTNAHLLSSLRGRPKVALHSLPALGWVGSDTGTR
eukprot:13837405-Alexandrium_andersonii.AAC.1